MFRMNRKSKKLLQWLLIVACSILLAPAWMPVYAATQASYYVSPNGSDTNPGTLARPFATITKARDAVRTVNRPLTGDIYVYLRCGTYYTGSPIAFGPADGGTDGFSVIYKAYNSNGVDEKPVISGGVPVTGWTLVSGSIYKATLNRDTKLRCLYVNGVRAKMTEVKNKQASGTSGTFTVAGTEPWAQTSGSAFDALTFSSSVLPAFANPGDVEIEWNWQWCDNIACVRDMTTSGTTTTVSLQQPTGAIAAKLRWGALGVMDGSGAKYNFTFRNAYELLASPGQFYFDRAAHTLYYYSRGENMNTAMVIAPVSEGLLQIYGASTTNRILNLQFYGITFMHDHCSLFDVAGSKGFVGSQSSAVFYKFRSDGDHNAAYFTNEDLPQSTIDVRNCDSLRIERCKFLQCSNAIAINLENDVINSTIIGNVFKDLAGNTVNISTPQDYIIGNGPLFPPGIAGAPQGNVVKDNFARNTSMDFIRVEGISGYFIEGLEISHNDMSYMPYGVIALGWYWGASGSIPPSTVMNNITISYNKVGNDHLVLHDGGTIYVMNSSPNSQIARNYTINGATAIMPDEGSGLWAINNNVVDKAASFWLYLWSNTIHNIVTDNNYTNQPSLQNNGTNCPVTNTHNESGNPWSAAAQAIINGAGIEAAYQDIMADTLAPQACATTGVTNMKNSSVIGNFSVRLAGHQIVFPQEFAGKTFSVIILDLQGRLIQKMTFDKNHPAGPAQRIDLSKGSYVVECSMDGKVVTMKMVNVR
ncbi:MAG TPA: T9SS type A sorting domain-containing protein [Chitinivibrionales bacterium]|nr:T9SS type A sorting domain-containing protein [Chitinivibrionales bacterium]